MQYGDLLVVATENNGTRAYRFTSGGVIEPDPVAQNSDLAPDSHTPVIVGDRLFGIWYRLYCLDLKNKLATVCEGENDAFGSYCSIVASADRLLITTLQGELLLVDAKADKFKLLSRLKILTDERGVYSHPAFVGTRMYLRGNSSIICLDLMPK